MRSRHYIEEHNFITVTTHVTFLHFFCVRHSPKKSIYHKNPCLCWRIPLFLNVMIYMSWPKMARDNCANSGVNFVKNCWKINYSQRIIRLTHFYEISKQLVFRNMVQFFLWSASENISACQDCYRHLLFSILSFFTLWYYLRRCFV